MPPWPSVGSVSIVGVMLDWIGNLLRGKSTPIFPVTVILSVLSFALAIVGLRKHHNLSRARSAFIGSTFPFCFVALYEEAWQNTGLLARPSIFTLSIPGELVLLSWVAVGLSTIEYWKWTSRSLILVATIAGLWMLWLVLGYPQWFEGSYVALAINLVTKFQFFLLFVFLLNGF